MRKIINGKAYDTETATRICDVSEGSEYCNDLRYENTCLYRTPRGRFFVAGTGGPMSRWCRPSGSNGWTGGSGMETVSEEEAKRLCEQHAAPDVYEATFGVAEEA